MFKKIEILGALSELLESHVFGRTGALKFGTIGVHRFVNSWGSFGRGLLQAVRFLQLLIFLPVPLLFSTVCFLLIPVTAGSIKQFVDDKM